MTRVRVPAAIPEVGGQRAARLDHAREDAGGDDRVVLERADVAQLVVVLRVEGLEVVRAQLPD